jgi:hypothetical protein
MSKRVHYLGGSTILKFPMRKMKPKQKIIGALEQAAETFKANPPAAILRPKRPKS